MPVRDGMVTLIAQLRSMSNAAIDDVTIGEVSYWTDEQLQDRLDQTGIDIVDYGLQAIPEKVDGSTVYVKYYLPVSLGEWIEGEGSDTWRLVDTQGENAPAYTVNLTHRLIQFNETTLNRTYYLSTRSFNLRAAAAQVWFEKAGHREALIDWKAGGQSFAEDLEWQHCMAMFRQYSGQEGVKSTRLQRIGYA